MRSVIVGRAGGASSGFSATPKARWPWMFEWPHTGEIAAPSRPMWPPSPTWGRPARPSLPRRRGGGRAQRLCRRSKAHRPPNRYATGARTLRV